MEYIYLLNKISSVGLNQLDPIKYTYSDIEPETYSSILVRSASMHNMQLSSNVLAIARAGAGVNNIPCKEYGKKGIVVFNTPGANANGVKELVIGSMILASRHLLEGNAWVKSLTLDHTLSKTVESGKKQFSGKELLGKTLGVIGLGAIGYRVANAAIDLGMKVYGYNPDIPVEYAWNLSRDVTPINSLEELFSLCDYITIHVPLNDSTKEMIHKGLLSNMKKGGILLNFSRDSLVNEKDIVEALNNGTLSTYVTDFPTAGLLHKENVITLPHLGASTTESEDNCAIMAVKQLKDYLETGAIVNSVNYPNCSLGPLSKPSRVCILHKNVPNMLGTFTSVFGACNLNICDMILKARGELAYAMFDVDHKVPEDMIDTLTSIDGVLKVRILNL